MKRKQRKLLPLEIAEIIAEYQNEKEEKLRQIEEVVVEYLSLGEGMRDKENRKIVSISLAIAEVLNDYRTEDATKITQIETYIDVFLLNNKL